jgi:hypothetical protein
LITPFITPFLFCAIPATAIPVANNTHIILLNMILVAVASLLVFIIAHKSSLVQQRQLYKSGNYGFEIRKVMEKDAKFKG